MLGEQDIVNIIQSQIDFNNIVERYFAKKIREEKHLNYAKQRFSKLMFGRAVQRNRDWIKYKEEISSRFRNKKFRKLLLNNK